MGSLYSNLKIFHYKEKLDSLPRDAITLAPLHLRIKPTNACNHRCRYCAYRKSGLQLGKDMDTRDSIPPDKMKQITADIIKMGVKAVTFSGGGEPFCYPYLLDTVKKLAASAVKFSALTNGSLLAAEAAEIFAHRGSWLRVSMDGWDDRSYSYYRGVPSGEFTKIIRNLKNFKKLGGACRLGVCLIIDKHNCGHVRGFIEKIKAAGVDNLKLAPCIVSNSPAKNYAYHRAIFAKVKGQIEKAGRKLADKNFRIFDSYHALNEKFAKGYHWCPYLQVLAVIGSDLNVYSCQDKAYNLDCGRLGSIKNRSFRDFWFKGREKFFKIDPARDCNHHCVANAKNKLILDYLDIEKEHLVFV